ncbi:hypothetical protein [Streptomyces sp. NPDC014006]|uniref:hypothetical protein n=1 Tax=Streptomyces sp. NPDC014006 TaxID=3364870 RepID=UPI0036F5AC17
MTRQVRRTAHRAIRVRNLVAASMALGAAVTVGACDSSAGDSKVPAQKSSSAPATYTPSASSADPEGVEKKAVLQAYDRMWAEQTKAYRKADAAGTDLDTYAAALALSSVKSDLRDLKSKGIIASGEPSHQVSVTQLDMAGEVPKARLTDCLDVSRWKLIYAQSGKPVAMPTNRLTRYVNQIKAEKWGKQWKILDVTPEQQAC